MVERICIMGKKRIVLPTLLLLVLSARLSAFTLLSVPKRPNLFQKRVQLGEINDAVRNKQATRASACQTTVFTSLGASNDVAMEGAEPSVISKFGKWANNNFFLLGMFVAVSLAKSFPSIGKNGGLLCPELFIGKFGVTLIFLLSGLSLEVTELTKAVSNVKLNSLVQLSTFAAWPFLIGLPLKWFVNNFLPNLLPPALVDGLLILTCLPTTVNMCIILTTAAGGNTASAICNAVISNLAGIFLTPALLVHFFGTQIKLPFLDMVFKLCNKVLLPVGRYFHV